MFTIVCVAIALILNAVSNLRGSNMAYDVIGIISDTWIVDAGLLVVFLFALFS